ncbi:MAG: GntR family transcriptional regulator, partial [Pseudoflavonifractor sp.]
MDDVGTTLVDQLYTKIKEDIVACNLTAGQKLIFRELAAHYSASETPIKQALNRLVAEGLVESVPRKGMWVRKITDSEILEILDIRLMIELYDIENVIIALNSNLKLRHMFEENLATHYECGK